MKLLFAGPSIVGLPIPDDICVREPASQGDITRATLEGVSAIGLIDGRFEDTASVWHKEILFALSEGVRVCGAASMGALRAAECQAFGMVGLGAIYERYATGELDDDAAVAQLHAPAELDHIGLTEPLVNVEATIEVLRNHGTLTGAESDELLVVASRMNFKERTYQAIVAGLRSVSSSRKGQIGVAIEAGKFDLKRRDAQALIDYLTALPDTRSQHPEWSLSVTLLFQSTLASARALNH